MRRTREQDQLNESRQPEVNTVEIHGNAVQSEDILIRSYDHQKGYDLDLTISTQDGDTVFQERYYLQPGHVTSEVDLFPRGTYTVKATLDNEQSTAIDCSIDDSPDHTVVIEVGNGTISLTTGLPVSA